MWWFFLNFRLILTTRFSVRNNFDSLPNRNRTLFISFDIGESYYKYFFNLNKRAFIFYFRPNKSSVRRLPPRWLGEKKLRLEKDGGKEVRNGTVPSDREKRRKGFSSSATAVFGSSFFGSRSRSFYCFVLKTFRTVNDRTNLFFKQCTSCVSIAQFFQSNNEFFLFKSLTRLRFSIFFSIRLRSTFDFIILFSHRPIPKNVLKIFIYVRKNPRTKIDRSVKKKKNV